MPRRRLLAHDAGAVPQGGSAVYRQLTCLSKSYWKEAAGHVHLLFALKQAGLYDDPLVEEDEEEEAPRAAAADEGSEPSRPGSAADFDNLEDVAGAKWKGRGKKKKKKKEEGEEDLYALLGLQHERWMATPEVIKSAYRKAALLHHPDKQGVGLATDEEEKQRIEERFKRIQEAYETLSDPARRREFDSTDDFDDSLPTSCAPADFYKVFGAAFRRNARWSVNQPVPDVGDDGTPMQRAGAGELLLRLLVLLPLLA